jgi:hypothetical protein
LYYLASEISIQPVGADIMAAAALLSQHFKIANASEMKEFQTSGPVVKIPGLGPPSSQQMPSLFNKKMGTTSLAGGYTVNHLSYQATRSKLAKTAYAGNGGQVIIVEIRLVHMPVGKVKPLLIKVHYF